MPILYKLIAMQYTNKINRASDIKLAVLGRAAVGKSALVVRYLTGRFIGEYDPNLEYTYKHQVTIEDEQTILEILDTAGQDGNLTHRESQIRWADGFALVYSITDRQSFEDIRQFKPFIDEIKKCNVPCMLLGNKHDLFQARLVSTEEGQLLAHEMSSGFFETSARDGIDDVTEAFYELSKDIKRRRYDISKTRRRSSASLQVKQVISKVFRGMQNTT